MTFHHRITTRFAEIDRAGVVYFARYFEYCHATYERLVTAMFGSLDQSFAAGQWMTPLVHAESRYTRPVRMGEELDIALRVERLGERSVTFAYDIRGADGEPRASARFVHAFIDVDFTSCAVPPAFRDGLRRLGLLPEGTTLV